MIATIEGIHLRRLSGTPNKICIVSRRWLMLPIAILTIWKYTCKYQIISLYEDIRTKLIQSGVIKCRE